jgi:predicted dienelactone hydrolase
MRILEIILLLLCVAFIIYLSVRKDASHKKIALRVILGILAAHLIFDGYRWQMIPIYILSLIITFCIYKEYPLLKGNWFFKSAKILLLAVLLLIGFALPTALPVFDLPETNGKFKVGSQYIHLKTDRDEIITENPDDKRELMIKVWYPANIKNEEKEAYLNDGDRISFAKKYNLQGAVFNYLDYVKTNTFTAPEIVNGQFPVLLFSHGSYSKASGYYAIIENIVSHGYIVLNINHTYESTGTLFPDGSIKLYNQEYDKKFVSTQEMSDLAWKSTQDYNNAKTEEEKLLVSENVLKKYIAANVTRKWSEDMVSVLDELQNWNTSTFLANHLDTSKIGVFAHSQGGSAAGQITLDDARISAGMNIDGVQWGTMVDTIFTKPFLNLSSDWTSPHPNFNKYAYRNGSTAVFYDAHVKNAGHASFMDIPLMINVPQLNESGTINPTDAYAAINETILLFFNRHLKDEENNLLKLNEKHPFLEIKTRK